MQAISARWLLHPGTRSTSFPADANSFARADPLGRTAGLAVRSDELDRAGQVGRAAKADVPRDQREVQQDRQADVERVVEAQVMPPRPRQPPQRPEVGIAVVDEHPCGAQGEESLIGAEAGVSFMTAQHVADLGVDPVSYT